MAIQVEREEVNVVKEHEVKIIEIKDREDGTADIVLEMSESFRQWFIKKENIEEWDESLFQKRFLDVLRKESGEE